VNLPKHHQYKDKKTLVFDLDETLIHCNENPETPSDVTLTIRMANGEQIDAGINIRPYAITLLNQLVKHFELIIFTASHSCYADVVLNYLDPEKQLFQHRLYR
jgi:CTD small phosphatase-like protein 2